MLRTKRPLTFLVYDKIGVLVMLRHYYQLTGKSNKDALHYVLPPMVMAALVDEPNKDVSLLLKWLIY
jgi:hypothetical protein